MMKAIITLHPEHEDITATLVGFPGSYRWRTGNMCIEYVGGHTKDAAMRSLERYCNTGGDTVRFIEDDTDA